MRTLRRQRGFWGPIIGAIIGGLITHDQNRRNQNRAEQAQRNAIQWRVADARAAGLHPVFALGGNVSSFSASGTPVMDAQTGAELGRQVEQRSIQQAQLRVMEAAAEKDFALASAAKAEQRRLDQEAFVRAQAGTPSISDFDLVDPVAQSHAVVAPGQSILEKPLPPVPPPYLTEKILAGLTRFNFPGVGEVLLPSQEAAESLEGMENTAIQAAILAANLAHYGPGGEERARRALQMLKEAAVNTPRLRREQMRREELERRFKERSVRGSIQR